MHFSIKRESPFDLIVAQRVVVTPEEFALPMTDFVSVTRAGNGLQVLACHGKTP
jgi:hypothetical protein